MKPELLEAIKLLNNALNHELYRVEYFNKNEPIRPRVLENAFVKLQEELKVIEKSIELGSYKEDLLEAFLDRIKTNIEPFLKSYHYQPLKDADGKTISSPSNTKKQSKNLGIKKIIEIKNHFKSILNKDEQRRERNNKSMGYTDDNRIKDHKSQEIKAIEKDVKQLEEMLSMQEKDLTRLSEKVNEMRESYKEKLEDQIREANGVKTIISKII